MLYPALYNATLAISKCKGGERTSAGVVYGGGTCHHVLAADNAAKKAAEKGAAKSYPAVVLFAVMFYMMNCANWGVMPGIVMLLSRNMVFLWCGFGFCGMSLGCFFMLYRLMFWRGSATIIATATRSCNSRSAESNASKSRNRQCFEDFVHITPSLSFLLFHADLLAAYIWCRKRF